MRIRSQSAVGLITLALFSASVMTIAHPVLHLVLGLAWVAALLAHLTLHAWPVLKAARRGRHRRAGQGQHPSPSFWWVAVVLLLTTFLTTSSGAARAAGVNPEQTWHGGTGWTSAVLVLANLALLTRSRISRARSRAVR